MRADIVAVTQSVRAWRAKSARLTSLYRTDFGDPDHLLMLLVLNFNRRATRVSGKVTKVNSDSQL